MDSLKPKILKWPLQIATECDLETQPFLSQEKIPAFVGIMRVAVSWQHPSFGTTVRIELM